MKNHNITAQMDAERFYHTVNINDAETFSFDFNAWADDNDDVDSVTWTIESGSASACGQALSANVATALITFSGAGLVVLSVKANCTSAVKKVFAEIRVKDPTNEGVDDYV